MTSPLDPASSEESTPGTGAEITFVQGTTFIKIKDAAASHRDILESVITLLVGSQAEVVPYTGTNDGDKPSVGKTDGGYV